MLITCKLNNLKHRVNKIVYINMAVFGVLMFGAVNASAIIFQPDETAVKDVWVQPGIAGVGDDEQLHVWKSSTVGGFKSLYEIQNLTALIPSVVSSANITSAVLNLYVLNTEGGSHGSHGPGFEGLDLPIEVSAMANPWAEGNWAGGTTEADALWTGAVSASGGPVNSYNVSGSNVDGWISLDVTDIVRSWMDFELSNGANGLAYYGFLIEAPNEVRASDNGVLTTAFNSSAATDAILRPYLEVSAIPVPAAFWLMGSGLIVIAGVARSPRLTRKRLA